MPLVNTGAETNSIRIHIPPPVTFQVITWGTKYLCMLLEITYDMSVTVTFTAENGISLSNVEQYQ